MPLPAGYVLDSPPVTPKLPAGYVLDSPSESPQGPTRHNDAMGGPPKGMAVPGNGEPAFPESGVMGALFTPVRGAVQAGSGVKRVVTEPGMDNKVGGAADVIEGVGKMASPYLIPAVATNPVGVALGMGSGALAQQGVQKASNALGVPKEYGRFAGDVAGIVAGTAASRPSVVQAVRNIPGQVARGAGNVAAEVIGKTTGAGAGPLRRAVTNPSADLIEQMRNPDELDVVGHLKNAADAVKQARGAEYSAELQRISGANHPPIDNAPVLQSLDGTLAKFRVGRASDGSLDFSSSPIGDDGQSDIAKIDGLIRNWKDWSPIGADALQRRIGDLYSTNGQARALVTGIRNDVSTQIKTAVPGYEQMTGGYAKASQFLDRLRDLSLDSKNPGTAVRKLMTTMNQNNEYRQGLIDALEPFTKVDLGGETAGLALSKTGPRGIVAPASGTALLGMIATHVLSPSAAVAAALASPRLMGELAVAMGKSAPLLNQVGVAIPKIPMTMGAGAIAGANGLMPPPRQQQQDMPPPGAQR